MINSISTDIITTLIISIPFNVINAITMFLFIYHIFFTIFSLKYINNFININVFSKLIISNQTEKNIGSFEDQLQFIILFLTVLSAFFFNSLFNIILSQNFFT
jgi:hypothetical protein